MHELDDKKLKKRAVVNIDIANDSVASADYKADQDPKTFKSEKTGRGPLTGDWKVSIRAGKTTLLCQDKGIFRQTIESLYISSLRIPLFTEQCDPRDDGLQAGNHPVQVVRAPRPCGELYPLHREEDLHKLPQTGQALINNRFKDPSCNLTL